MCQFCTHHGEGKKWYENISNYTEEIFHQVNSERNLKVFLSRLYHSLTVDVEAAYSFKKRFPRVYRLVAYPLVTRHLKKTHFGQIVPVEDIEHILDSVSSIVRLPCVCRKATLDENMRYCFGIGMDLTAVYKDVPDFNDFDRVSRQEAKELIRHHDAEGMAHSVWSYNTPFIGALCNCDRNCMAYRFQLIMDLGKAMWKGEYVAIIDPLQCSGCRECMQRCYFGALTYDRRNVKCTVNVLNCYGCGICRAACKNNAISLFDRSSVAQAAQSW